MLLTAYTLWEFSRFTSDIDLTWVIIINFLQGVSFACFVVPVNAVAFSTLPEAQRDVGTSFYALLNNVGRSLGIALLASYLASQAQVANSELSAEISPFNDYVRHFGLPDRLDPETLSGLGNINRIVGQQAELLAYISDFQLLALVVLCCIPVVFLMNKPRRAGQKV